MSDIAFAVRLTEGDWDEFLRGWRCPALGIPGAVVEDLYVDGSRADKGKFEVIKPQSLIRWSPSEQPQRVAAIVRLTENLTLGKETDRWKRLAVVLPVVATISAAAISGTATYLSAKQRILVPSTQVEAQKPSRADGALKSADASKPPLPTNPEFNILMPRGDKVIVLWEGRPKDQPGDMVLVDAGVSLDEVDAGTKLAYAALTKKDVESIRYGPLILGEKLAEGYSKSVFRPGPAPGAGYTEFQLFQGDNEFKILVHVDGKDDAAPIQPAKIGIDWNQVRAGLKKALEALYQGKRQYSFDNVGLFTEADGSWHYRLPYRRIRR